ncbi:MAG TPA: 4Fe-4S binding protein [Polyangiales bacterium]
MAYKIVASECSVCGACEYECPNAAIAMKGDAYRIDPTKCTECKGKFDSPRCVEACPSSGTCVPA